jgi:hypothetical protein
MSSFTRIRLVRAEFFLSDRQTEMKLIVAFRNFANAPKYITHYVENKFICMCMIWYQ